MIYKTGNLLDIGTTYTYHYDGGSTELRNRFSMWLAFYSFNFGFKFSRLNTAGFFRIGFDDSINSSAVLGKEIYHPHNMDPATRPTTANMEPSRYYMHGLEEFDVTAIHEIGHMIGVSHEHINWQNAPNYVPGHEPQVPLVQRHIYTVTDYNPKAVMGYHLACSNTVDDRQCGYRNRDMKMTEIREFAQALNSPRLVDDNFINSKGWKEIHNTLLHQGAVPPIVR